MKAFADSVKFALMGVRAAWSGRNFKIQLTAACIVIICGLAIGITATEWLVVLIFTGLVLSAEIMNSAIEQLVDLVSPEFHPAAGKVKDLAAGAVLVLAFFSAVAGLVIFIPYLLNIITE